MSRVRKRLEQYKAELERQTQYKAGLPGSALDIVKILLADMEEDEKEHGWIPVSERLPEDGTYITTLDGELVGQEEPFTGMCGIENGKWEDEDSVIAWMPLPEPYKEN
jgi:hypothetical protein